MCETYKSRINRLKTYLNDARELRRLDLLEKFLDICDELSNQLGADTAHETYTPAHTQWDVRVESLKLLKDHIQVKKEVLDDFLDRIEETLNKINVR